MTAKELRDQADRYEKAVSSNAGPSSQEYISPERREHYFRMAENCRRLALEIENREK